MSTESISNSRADVKHSNPIPIGGNAPNRRRAPSFSSSEGSPTSPQSLQTPLSPSPPRVATSPSASPILSYFMSASPTKPNPTFPFRRPFGAPPVLEDDESLDADTLPTFHGRSASATWTTGPPRFPQPSSPPIIPIPEAQQSQQQRGTGVLRRLSLSSGFGRPNIMSLNRPQSPPRPGTPPPSAVNMAPQNGGLSAASPGRKPRRATTLGVRPADSKPRRAPSPMGERILKGHFDGFN